MTLSEEEQEKQQQRSDPLRAAPNELKSTLNVPFFRLQRKIVVLSGVIKSIIDR